MIQQLGVLGAGIVTDAIGHITELQGDGVFGDGLGNAQRIDPGAIAAQDALSQLALGAVHQAWTMGRMDTVDSEGIGLVVESAWGAIDSTRAYLESMFEAEGRYASPRHFSRSVYSSVASNVAIHFGIRGPCETLVFGRCSIVGVLQQAWRLLAAERCTHVVALWADQGGELAGDLAARAARQLHRAEFRRYAGGVGHGAIALVVTRGAGVVTLDLAGLEEPTAGGDVGRHFPLDGAVGLLRGVLWR